MTTSTANHPCRRDTATENQREILAIRFREAMAMAIAIAQDIADIDGLGCDCESGEAFYRRMAGGEL